MPGALFIFAGFEVVLWWRVIEVCGEFEDGRECKKSVGGLIIVKSVTWVEEIQF